MQTDRMRDTSQSYRSTLITTSTIATYLNGSSEGKIIVLEGGEGQTASRSIFGVGKRPTFEGFFVVPLRVSTS